MSTDVINSLALRASQQNKATSYQMNRGDGTVKLGDVSRQTLEFEVTLRAGQFRDILMDPQRAVFGAMPL